MRYIHTVSDRYFPNKSTVAMALEHKIRRLAALLPEQDRCELYEAFSSAHPEFVETKFKLNIKTLTIFQQDVELLFPRPLPMVKFGHILCDYEEWLRRKYSFPGFVEVEQGDDEGYDGAFPLPPSLIVSISPSRFQRL